MVHNIQEYINGIDNKQQIHVLDLSNQQLTGEINDLTEFTNLKVINVSNNQITNLDFLDTLPNKENLKEIDLSGNQIKEIDFINDLSLFGRFHKLEKINLQNNPASVKNLDRLGGSFPELVKLIEERNVKFDPLNSPKGTIAEDLLNHAQKLINRGENKYFAYRLQEFIQGKQPDNSEEVSLIISGLIVFALFALIIGC